MCNQRLYKCIYQPSKPLIEKGFLIQVRLAVPKQKHWQSWFDGEAVSEDFMNVREQDV